MDIPARHTSTSSLASTCVWRATNISGIDGTMDQWVPRGSQNLQQHCFVQNESKVASTVAWRQLSRNSRSPSSGSFWWCVTAMMPRYERQGHQETGRKGSAKKTVQEAESRLKHGDIVGSTCGNREARIRNNTIDKMGHISSNGEETTCAERSSQDGRTHKNGESSWQTPYSLAPLLTVQNQISVFIYLPLIEEGSTWWRDHDASFMIKMYTRIVQKNFFQHCLKPQ